MHLPKILYLDLDTWRCGKDSNDDNNKLGEGQTYLLNNEGYSCCLGQWIRQTYEQADILNLARPLEIENEIIELIYIDNEVVFNSFFSGRCMVINDREDLTIKKKIEYLRKEVEGIGRELIAKNSNPVAKDSKPIVSENIHKPEVVLA